VTQEPNDKQQVAPMVAIMEQQSGQKPNEHGIGISSLRWTDHPPAVDCKG
jgi:hypothetical protein